MKDSSRTNIAGYGGYQPIIDAVESLLGVSVDLLSTGGGCVALGAELEGGAQIMITDAQDTLSTWAQRAAAKADGICYGYLVGVYADVPTGYEPVSYVAGRVTETPAGVVALVQRALHEAAAVGFTPRGEYIEPTVVDVI
ncbi:hypothetical protein H7I87_00415 [Mycobacterium timonense]|uniref:Uncharacterized protein n=2 Tax=Mycobacterium avium complex (MAC) TaxID=120793 RepID=A0AAW5S172_MYCBC|nr:MULTISPECIES: hypothetical protein [Mycobacterium avium complex (MAC)]MCV6988681.1 hypothetical protein [Mycobacterium bouchedurhonense]MCV6993229.1 hypothetical protein [Mycobacterium timonense]MDV3306409.1 hypothetical protein [Mycobacterium avium subsp. hominissuis]ORA45527.1 hypothetical protein BST19_20120 [Mycobacterium bouchedurhonense]ORB77099.1 hypothetical protein BST46_26435 [Mycobacterium timonense]